VSVLVTQQIKLRNNIHAA